jgi:Tol biopolymer transport system component
VALDERLRRELEEAGRPGDPSGVYEELIRRRERRRLAHRMQVGALAVVVIVGTIAGVLGLSRLFGAASDGDAVVPLVPVQPSEATNGLVAFTTGERIVVQAADGSRSRNIPAPAPGLAWHIAWSPNGTQLALAVFTDPGRSLWVMQADGSDATMIAEGSNVSRPSWHPDGVHLTYSLVRHGMTEVHVTRSDGTGDRVIYSEEASGTYAVFSATFSPDGSQIVFDAGTDVGFDIFLMDADGSNVRQITTTGTDYNPSWSPDGSLVLFTRQEDSSSDIFVMRADGSDVRRLTDGDGSTTNLNALYSPDGTLITYGSSGNGGVSSIVVMNADGSDAHTMIDGEVLGFSWQPVPNATKDIPSPPNGGDLGLGFPVCNVSSIDGEFVEPNVTSTALVATRRGDTGRCPLADEAFNVVAIDADGDRLADASFGPIECTYECRAFSAPDIDHDGTDELLVIQEGGVVVGLRLYDVDLGGGGGDIAIVPVNVAEPGDPQGGFEPGKQASFLLGGDAFELYTLRCDDLPLPYGLGLVATVAGSLPHDSTDAEWHAHETTLVLRRDGLLRVIHVRDFTEPVTDDPNGPSFASSETLCGSNLGPVIPIP